MRTPPDGRARAKGQKERGGKIQKTTKKGASEMMSAIGGKADIRCLPLPLQGIGYNGRMFVLGLGGRQ